LGIGNWGLVFREKFAIILRFNKNLMGDIIEQHKDTIVDTQTQQTLNKPLEDKTGFNEGHEDFLKDLIKKLEDKVLDTHDINTLYNKPVYEELSEEKMEATDVASFNIMSIIRQIEQLWNLEHKATFQIQNLVETVFQMKSKLEEKHGDVLII
jgi:hypothetical protein